jgi:hypothetical protein
MPIVPIWDNDEKTIVRHIFQGHWSIEEIRVSARMAWQMMHTVEHPVHAILDMREGDILPSGGVLAQTSRIATNRPKNAGVIILITRNPIVRTLGKAFRAAYGRFHPNLRFYFADTIEDAYQLIREHGAKHPPTTPPLKPNPQE